MKEPPLQKRAAGRLESTGGIREERHASDTGSEAIAQAERPAIDVDPAQSRRRGFFAVYRGEILDQVLQDRNLLAVLVTVASRAWWSDAPNLAGLAKGQCQIGDFESFGFRANERQQYRTALEKARKLGFLTTRGTSRGTIATLVNTDVFDPFGLAANQQGNHQLTTGQPSTNQPVTTKNNGNKENQGNKVNNISPSAEKNSIHHEEGLKFADWFRSTLPDQFNLPKNYREQWAKTFDDLIRLDGHTPDEIHVVCRWAREDQFWSGQFLSPAKLRKRKDGVTYFDSFAAKSRKGAGQRSAAIAPDAGAKSRFSPGGSRR